MKIMQKIIHSTYIKNIKMMKKLPFLLLLFCLELAAQNKNKWHTVKLDSADARKIIGSTSNYYIASVTDKRADRSNIGTNLHEGKIYPLHFESDSAALAIHQLLNKVIPKAEGKKAIHAEINYFKLGNYYLSGVSNEGSAYLDIDFYDTDATGEKRLICHYHGVSLHSIDNNVPKNHPTRFYFVLRGAIKKLNQVTNQAINQAITLEKVDYLNPSYVPKKGLYISLMDYQRNTPFPTKQPYQVLTANGFEYKYERKLERNLHLNFRGDSLFQDLLGYSDGKHFFLTTKDREKNKTLTKSITNGRYLYIAEKLILKDNKDNNNTYLPYMGGGFIGGLIVGAANAAINASNNTPNSNSNYIILDIVTGDVLNFDSSAFKSEIPSEDNDYLEYKTNKKEPNLIALIQKMNEIYAKNNP
jgi:hypothetical protein